MAYMFYGTQVFNTSIIYSWNTTNILNMNYSTCFLYHKHFNKIYLIGLFFQILHWILWWKVNNNCTFDNMFEGAIGALRVLVFLGFSIGVDGASWAESNFSLETSMFSFVLVASIGASWAALIISLHNFCSSVRLSTFGLVGRPRLGLGASGSDLAFLIFFVGYNAAAWDLTANFKSFLWAFKSSLATKRFINSRCWSQTSKKCIFSVSWVNNSSVIEPSRQALLNYQHPKNHVR